MTPLQNSSWYLSRLFSMSLVELIYRLRQQWITIDDRCYFYWRQTDTSLSALKSETLTQFMALSLFLQPEKHAELVNSVNKRFPNNCHATIQQAEALCQGQVDFFGHTFILSEPINWRQDPQTGRLWPDTFYGNIDTRDGRTIGGVKWVWELNRHHHLVTLGKAYYLTGEERFAVAVYHQIESWIAANPPLRGVNWSSGLELAIRLINWCWALTLMRPAAALTPAFFASVQQSIVAQAGYIARHLSAHSSANNHLMGEAAGLAVAGLCFPWLPEAGKWRETGLKIMERELAVQIHPDGVPAEQAASYLAFILDFNLIVWQLAELNGYDIPPIWPTRLSAACDFIVAIMDENGHVPAIGDSDDAWVARLDDRPEANNYRSILTAAAVLLNRPDLKAAAGRWDEKSHWLLGEKGYFQFQQLPDVAPQPVSRVFANGGYSAMRAPGRVIVVDHGPLGYLSTAAHGHADALSLTVSLDGRPFLIDPGTYAYQEGGEWRDFYRSTAAHNTIVVDGQNQSEMLGTFLWGRKTNGRLLHWRSAAEYDFCLADHDGYASSLGVSHRRAVFFHKPHWLLVRDWLSGQGEHFATQWWHFHPSCQVEINNELVTIRVSDCQSWLWIGAMDTEPSPALTLHLGETSPIQGWYSDGYGRQRPAPALAVSGRFRLPIQLTAIFCFDERMTAVEFQRQKAHIQRSFTSVLQEVQF